MKTGKYRHFRTRNFYDVIGVAMHSETQEKMVLYRALYECPDLDEEYGHHPYFVRPYAMFLETVEHEGKTVPRFEYIGE